MLENDDNRAVLLDPLPIPEGKYRAQWNDDYHHVWHVILTGETPRLLRRLRHATRAVILRANAACGLCLSGRGVGSSRRAGARRTDRRAAAAGIRQLPAEPRPDRQPRAAAIGSRVQADDAAHRGGARRHAARADAAA